MTEIRFEGTVAVVTGAGGGMGRSIARTLGARGCKVAVVDIELEAAERVVKEIESDGGTAAGYKADVSDAAMLEELASRTLADLGPVGILVNNAGVTMRPLRAVWDASFDDFKWMMDVNYYGVVNGIRSYLPQMLGAASHKHIVNTSSMAPLAPDVGYGMYTASKAAVDGISNVLRLELAEQGEDIGVTILYPGLVRTQIGTSERLRPVEERSDTRQVREYRRRSAPKGAMHEPIDPNLVGGMVVRAIERNAPYVLTHPVPEEQLRDWIETIVASYTPSVEPNP